MKRDWGRILARYIEARRKETEPLRKQVWDDMAPLRQALSGSKEK